MDWSLKMIAVILVALAVGIGLGFWGSREWISVPLWKIEGKLRKDLAEMRIELWDKTTETMNLRYWLTSVGVIAAPHWPFVGSVAHFDLTEPKIERREHSDVFKIASIDALIEGTR
jgi:hypothetical protein